MSDKKFANLDRKSLDRLNDMQHEITDAEGNSHCRARILLEPRNHYIKKQITNKIIN